jgi:formate dehydrogenase accessory protein FdhE
MASPWQRRIQRAQELRERHAFAAEILAFYIHIVRCQERLREQLNGAVRRAEGRGSNPKISPQELSELTSQFEFFLSVPQQYGPAPLAELARQICESGPSLWSQLLVHAWEELAPSDAGEFLAQAFLQPYAELLRSCSELRPAPASYALCPFCTRKPSFGVLRQLGEGAARSMVCSFCLAEWDFRRLVCPGCGQENDQKLPVFTANDFDYIRVECCDSCKTYIKSIDLTRNGRAEPMVDELASAPLDLWAREHGYAKLHSNILGM